MVRSFFYILIALAWTNSALAALQNQQPPPGDSPRRPQGEDNQPLTHQQITTVKQILSKYNQATLTVAQAKAINEAFRSAGLRRGPALQNAIQQAGFDPRKISSLAPPPNQDPNRGRKGKDGKKPTDPDPPLK